MQDSILEHEICDYYVQKSSQGIFICYKQCHNGLCSIVFDTYTLHYLVRGHEGLLKKHHKIFQSISRIRLILFFMAILPYFCGKRCTIFLKPEGKPLFFQSLTRCEARILQFRGKILLCCNRVCPSDVESSVQLVSAAQGKSRSVHGILQ